MADLDRGRLFRKKRDGGFEDGVGRKAGHAAVVERAAFLLAGAAEDFDGGLTFFVEVDFGPLGVGGAEEGDNGDIEGGCDMSRAGVVGDHEVAAADDFFE